MSQVKKLQDEWKNFLNKKMDRKGFLAHLGAGAFAATGLGALLKSLDGSDSKQQDSYTYGGGAYGGNNKKQS